MPKRKRKSNKKQVKVEATAKSIPIPSGLCLPGQCNCILPNEVNISDILISVKDQRAYCDMPARGPLNMLSVELAIVEDYLLHSRKSEHLKAKQVRLREALRRISYKMNMPFLNTINTKTTPFRLFGKALWDGCRLEPTYTRIIIIVNLDWFSIRDIYTLCAHVRYDVLKSEKFFYTFISSINFSLG